MPASKTMAIPYRRSDDAVLVRLAQGDDTRAFDELTCRYQNKVYGLSYRILRHEDDAAEALQDAFLSAYRGLKSFKGNSSFSTWLFRIATNASLMILRKRRPNHVSVDQPLGQNEDAEPMQFPDWAAQPLDALLTAETREVMEQGLQRVPSELRTVFVLRDIEGLSNAEVSAILELSVPAVKSRLHRCRISLRDWMADHFEDPTAPRPPKRARQTPQELGACAERAM